LKHLASPVLCLILASPPAYAQLLIGVSAPLTGFAAPFSIGIADGAKFAAETINARGGVNGKKIEVVISDDGCDGAAASAKAERMILVHKVDALIGFPCGSVALAASAIAARFDKLMITIAPVAGVTGADRPVLRVIGRDDQLASLTADFLNVMFQNKRVGALLSSRTPGFDAVFRSALQSRRIPLAQIDVIPDLVATLPNWKDAVDVVVAGPGTVPEQSIASLTAGASVVVPTTIFPDSARRVTGDTRELFVIANPSSNDFPQAGEVIARAKSAGYNTDRFFSYSYAAVQVFAAATARTPQTSGRALFSTVRESGAETIIGKLAFDRNGDLLGWRQVVYRKSDRMLVSYDVCKTDNCAKYEQCPRDCPK